MEQVQASLIPDPLQNSLSHLHVESLPAHHVYCGSRKSILALKQTNIVIQHLESMYPTLSGRIGVKGLDPLGDRDKVTTLWKFSSLLSVNHSTVSNTRSLRAPNKQTDSKGLWTEELEDLLHKGDVSFVVHSLKDMPTTLPKGFTLAAVLERADPRDALVIHPKLLESLKRKLNSRVPSLFDLPKGSVIGSSSLRRIAQLQRYYPHLCFEPIRGNVPTRLRKLDESDINIHETAFDQSSDGTTNNLNEELHQVPRPSPALLYDSDANASFAANKSYSALILAAAGLDRLGLGSRISARLSSTHGKVLHAVGQGALGVEAREDDHETLALLAPLNHFPTLLACTAERALLRSLEGGCSTPVGVETCWTRDSEFSDEMSEKLSHHSLHLKAVVLSIDGSKCTEVDVSEKLDETDVEGAEKLGERAAEELRNKGAFEILQANKENTIRH